MIYWVFHKHYFHWGSNPQWLMTYFCKFCSIYRQNNIPNYIGKCWHRCSTSYCSWSIQYNFCMFGWNTSPWGNSNKCGYIAYIQTNICHISRWKFPGSRINFCNIDSHISSRKDIEPRYYQLCPASPEILCRYLIVERGNEWEGIVYNLMSRRWDSWQRQTYMAYTGSQKSCNMIGCIWCKFRLFIFRNISQYCSNLYSYRQVMIKCYPKIYQNPNKPWPSLLKNYSNTAGGEVRTIEKKWNQVYMRYLLYFLWESNQIYTECSRCIHRSSSCQQACSKKLHSHEWPEWSSCCTTNKPIFHSQNYNFAPNSYSCFWYSSRNNAHTPRHQSSSNSQWQSICKYSSL